MQGTSFVAGLKPQMSLEAKYLQSDGRGSTVLTDYTAVSSYNVSKPSLAQIALNATAISSR
jgi:hypothetical protein